MKVKLLFFIPALVYTLIIAYLSLINLAATPVGNLGMSDKLMHGGAYFGMAFLWLIFMVFSYENKNLGKIIALICGFVIIFGILLEALQYTLTDYRELDFYDILANSIGATLAGIAIYFLKDNLIGLKTQINSFLIKN